MNRNFDTARALYLELRALRLKVSAEDDPDGGFLDYRIALDGLHAIPAARARSVRRRVLNNHDELVRILLDRRDPDLDAIRKEGLCG